jgi:hypothetical protein
VPPAQQLRVAPGGLHAWLAADASGLEADPLEPDGVPPELAAAPPELAAAPFEPPGAPLPTVPVGEAADPAAVPEEGPFTPPPGLVPRLSPEHEASRVASQSVLEYRINRTLLCSGAWRHKAHTAHELRAPPASLAGTAFVLSRPCVLSRCSWPIGSASFTTSYPGHVSRRCPEHLLASHEPASELMKPP